MLDFVIPETVWHSLRFFQTLGGSLPIYLNVDLLTVKTPECREETVDCLNPFNVSTARNPSFGRSEMAQNPGCKWGSSQPDDSCTSLVDKSVWDVLNPPNFTASVTILQKKSSDFKIFHRWKIRCCNSHIKGFVKRQSIVQLQLHSLCDHELRWSSHYRKACIKKLSSELSRWQRGAKPRRAKGVWLCQSTISVCRKSGCLYHIWRHDGTTREAMCSIHRQFQQRYQGCIVLWGISQTWVPCHFSLSSWISAALHLRIPRRLIW